MPATNSPHRRRGALLFLALAATCVAVLAAVSLQRSAWQHSLAPPSGAAGQSGQAALPLPGGRFHRGMVIETHVGEHDHPAGPRTLRTLAALGVDAVQVVPFAYQPDIEKPELRFRDLTDRQVVFIHEAHAQGMAVLLKPHIWSRQFWGPQARWHGDLRMQSEADWQRWFTAYRRYILHYARIAENTGCEGFSIGLEYVQATRERPADWQALAAAVRAVYHGPITYGANLHGEAEEITFWEDLDWIGVNVYPRLAAAPGADVDALVRGYAPTVELLARLAARHRRPVLITEIGFPSVRGAAIEPWAWPDGGDIVDLAEQERAYESTFRALSDQPWLAGLYFWKWPIDGTGGGPDDPEYTPLGKPAAQVLARHYRARRAAAALVDAHSPAR